MIKQQFVFGGGMDTAAQRIDDVLKTHSKDWKVFGRRHDTAYVLESHSVTLRPDSCACTKVFVESDVDLYALLRVN